MMLNDRWITDRTPTERFPDYTRANAGEVLRDPVSPLGWTFGWEEGVVLGCRDAFVSFGVFDADEYGEPPETFGMFGGYFYNSLTQPRLMGVRMPGATPEAIDKAYFDDRPDVPPYEPKDWHESPEHEAKLAETMAYVMSGVRHDPADEQKARAAELRDSRPDLAELSNEALVARARSVQPDVVSNFEQHAWVTVGASLPSGAIAAVADGIGRSTDVAALLSGLGDVDSAGIAQQLWALSRLVRNSAELTAVFDAGLDGLAERIEGTDLADGLDAFLYEHGGRGPNEWDIAASSYETTPGLAYAQLDVMRLRGDEADPIAALKHSTAERARLRAEIERVLAGDAEALGTFQAAMDSATVWMSARERTKSYNIRTLHEARMCFNELGRRMADAGHIDKPAHVYMLLSEELDEFLG
ncbi:MAG: PEP-utilizing enzyme, partial [Acidimicrobiales bacterium]